MGRVGRRINHHLKVFAAVRKEAYARLPQRTAMSQQYRGSAIDLAYSLESLREIFVNNIRLLKPDRMVRPERLRADPLVAFFGRSHVTHIYTREDEEVFDYVCRHTLLRPRDLMTIGERLAVLRPEERANEVRLKETVNHAATEIAHEYLAEIAPVHGFGTLMLAHEDGPVRKALEEAVLKWGQAPRSSRRGAATPSSSRMDPVALAQMARQTPGRPRLRIALHHGEVQIDERDGDLAAAIAGGEAILWVARVEPHVAPGQIWATEEFCRELSQRPSLWRTTPVPGDGGECFNVKKDGSTEPDQWVRLFRLEL